MTRYKLVNGETIELTAEEEAQLNAEEQTWADGAFDRAIKSLREDRNNKLKETDYFALSDVTMTDEMKNYRQELRDITNGLTTVAEVEAVTFPTKPE